MNSVSCWLKRTNEKCTKASHVRRGSSRGKDPVAGGKMSVRFDPYISSRKPADGLAHDRLWPLIANAQPTNSHNIFEGALFHFRNTSAPTIKGRPPFKYTVYFYLLSCTCDANFTPFTYSLHSISLSVHLAHSHRSNINFTTSGYSLSTLPTHI